MSLQTSQPPLVSGTAPHTLSNHQGSTPPSAPESLRLLLVEDHETTLKVLTRLLARVSHQVLTAYCLHDARKIAAQNTLDAVVSDLDLPDGTGTELMREVNETYNLRGIALSGYVMEDDVQHPLEAGFVTHLVKPVKFEELQPALENLQSKTAK